MSDRDASGSYASGMLLLGRYLDGSAGPAVLGRAHSFIRHAVDRDPDRAFHHAVLGYTLDLQDRLEDALSCLERAHRLAPEDIVLEVYLLTLLVDTGRERDALRGIEAAAGRHGVDLDALRAELRAAGFPIDARTLLMNGFPSARNHFASWLRDEVDRLAEARPPGRGERLRRRERRDCEGARQEVEAGFDVASVPDSLRGLAAWAVRVGIGDDPCRALLLAALSEEERARLIEEVDRDAAELHGWLDGFGDADMTPEASAFLYMALGVEEIRQP